MHESCQKLSSPLHLCTLLLHLADAASWVSESGKAAATLSEFFICERFLHSH